ncbi:hypothetical protein OPIT5_09475 [Opitutaceae bacterium TAV5]|nr:hypothetical protein OPIT5_09475 [Opitutaceae bacterium TAV5]
MRIPPALVALFGAPVLLSLSLSAQVTVFPDAVGIKVSAPAYPLDVNGRVSVGGPDLILGKRDGRNQGQKLGNRALVHCDRGSIATDCLFLNYDGDFEGGVVVGGPQMIVTGNVGIGVPGAPTHKLTVNGPIRAKEIIVDTGWADYVFADGYRLTPLSEVEEHIKNQRHLPGVPAASAVAAEGVSLGEMQTILLAKIEELTLHLIEQDKKLADQNRILSGQARQLEAWTARIARLETENALLKQTSK